MGKEDVGDSLEDEGAAGEEDAHRATHTRTLPHLQGNKHHTRQHRLEQFRLHLIMQQAPSDQRIPTPRSTSTTGTCAARVMLSAMQMWESTRMSCAVRVLFPCRALAL